ncbi:hypothetical protein PCNPT3_10355 [Psychromonas sp. CNPT3]|uniref:tetratricopeptide repeat protein n=1 Tax=Psychromonas sp. CNPT3 TaxID=314282 RepID=UPI00006E34DC|nr:tetratricopeptide repeat protein [Psychromonas sp. CNPT3]AGH82009.1 hypothetical protein PCNPT3_10355 [Psychromonas sp. CNPT3]
MDERQLRLKLKRAGTLAKKRDNIKSIALCKKIINAAPQEPHAYKLLVTNLIALKRFDEVEENLKKVLTILSGEESNVLVHLLGCNYLKQEKYSDALTILEGLFNQTGHSHILLDIGLALFHLGEYKQAREVYLKLIEIEPDHHQAKFNLYPILLYFEEYKAAWTCFHSRLERQEIKDQVHWFAPKWNGESLVNKVIIIYPEQGMGDNLAYSGCFDEAILDAKQTYIICDPRLKKLYEYNFSGAIILSFEQINTTHCIDQKVDLQILAGSLSYLYRLSTYSFVQQPLLKIAPHLIEDKRKKSNQVKLHVGISWFHGKVNNNNVDSMPLEALLPLLKIPGIEWVNLQFGEHQRERDELKHKYGVDILHFNDCGADSDFDHYGALISNLDLVISASNAALMFATRLGVKSWMFTPTKEVFFEGGEFTALLAEKNARYFYKKREPNWDNVVADFCDEIKLILEEKK